MNIKNVMMMAAMMPAFALAETNSNSAPASVEANDTTIRVNDQNIVIKQDGEQTSVKIYKMNGNEMNEMTKISETQFVGKAEAETGEGDAPFPRLGVATVHLVVASHASPAAWQLAAAEEERWIMTLQTALALAQGLWDERRGDKYLFYFLTIYELGL